MAMKGTIKPDHIGRNKFELTVIGLPPITFTTISGLEDELETADLPDRTRATGGFRKAGEIVCNHPTHHAVEEGALELWFKSAQDPVSPSYKKPAMLSMKSISNSYIKLWTLTGMFPRKRKLPDGEMENEGELALTEWTFSVDDIQPTS